MMCKYMSEAKFVADPCLISTLQENIRTRSIAEEKTRTVHSKGHESRTSRRPTWSSRSSNSSRSSSSSSSSSTRQQQKKSQEPAATVAAAALAAGAARAIYNLHPASQSTRHLFSTQQRQVQSSVQWVGLWVAPGAASRRPNYCARF